MFVDACAIVSIFAQEDSAPAYEEALANVAAPFTSALAAWEAIVVLSRPDQLDCRYSEAQAVIVEWLDIRNIALVETGSPQALLTHAIHAAERHGIGRKALSNFDCFHYAYAKTLDQPILTFDALLQKTDAETLPAPR